MRSMITRAVAAFALTATVSVPMAIAADSAEEKAVKARRGYYQLVLHNAGPLFGMAKGDVAYNAEAATTAANNLKALSSMNVMTLWPAGSDNEALAGKTRALPKICADFPGVGQKSKAFKAAIDGMVANAGGGLDSLRGSIGALGASCKGCHDNYRTKDF